MDNKSFSNNLTVSSVLEGNPPKQKGSFPFNYMIYIFADQAVYDLFSMSEDFINLIHQTRLEVMCLFVEGRFSKESVTLFYPELWMPPSMQVEWRNRLSRATGSTKEVRLITNSPLLCQGLSRYQITQVECTKP